MNYWGNPWNADDDTDIEYVYLHELATRAVNRFTPDALRDAWINHINRAIWVSNANARSMMDRGIRPPMTAAAQGLAQSVTRPINESLMIDAQLTTELFGALCPGMPDRALEMADLPIRTTAHGHAVHAAQFYVVLYSLALEGEGELTGPERAEHLVERARAYIPDTSKAADIVDFVLADYRANPDKTDWVKTRDGVYQRYVAEAQTHGFIYRAWYESSVNFAMGIVTLLYGGLDFEKTTRIGTLAGFDADNQPATMGGLIGLATGPQFLAQHGWCSDRYRWSDRRDALIDYLPDDPTGEDTFTLMAARSLAIVDREVTSAGGYASASAWLLPPVSHATPLVLSPTQRLMSSSANLGVRAAGGSVAVSCSVPGQPQPGFAVGTIDRIADGFEHDFAGIEDDGMRQGFWSTQRAGGQVAGEHAFEVRYDRAVTAKTIRFIAGDVFPTGAVVGGWFGAVRAEVLIGGNWTPATLDPAAAAPVADGQQAFQTLDFVLVAPMSVTGARVIGFPGVGSQFVTCAEIEVFSPPPALPFPTYDVNGDGAVNVEDVYAWHAEPRDVDGDGSASPADARLVSEAARWDETARMAHGWR